MAGLAVLRNQGLLPPNPGLLLLLKNQPFWKPGPHSCASRPPTAQPLQGPWGGFREKGPRGLCIYGEQDLHPQSLSLWGEGVWGGCLLPAGLLLSCVLSQ